MIRSGRLLFPSLRWDQHTGFEHERETIERALRIGVGGFTIFGGTVDGVRELTTMLRSRSSVPLLIASDLERGAGQQFRGATQLPPLGAIGWVDQLDDTRWAGSWTAQEALSVGVNWLLAPVADTDLEPRNPIVGTRAFGTDPERVAAHLTAWLDGARRNGVLCCAKHFPGHGRTVEDSHETLPHVGASREQLDADLLPFRAAINAGIDSIMTAHVVYDAFDDHNPATISHRIITGLLRDQLGFDGLVVTDALNMRGLLHGERTEAGAAIAALNAGCDALLYPTDVAAVADALDRAIGRELDDERVAQALHRIDAAAQRATVPESAGWQQYDASNAESIAQRALVVSRGTPHVADSIDLLTIDDDTGGPFPPPSRAVFEQTLRERQIEVRNVDYARSDATLVVAIYADIRAWKGKPGLSRRAAERTLAVAAVNPAATVAFFGHPRLTADLPARHILTAWGGEAIMQRAAARWLPLAR